jgi:hypothetical protein
MSLAFRELHFFMVLSTSIMIITLGGDVFLEVYLLKLRKDFPTARVK